MLFIGLIGLVLILGACSKENDQSTEKKDKDKQVTKQKKEKQKAQKKRNEKPYEAIKPSKNAKKMETHYSTEEIENIPRNEAHGETKKREISLGETLPKDKEDPSNGPLKNNRLVAYYGTPLSENMGILGEYDKEEMMSELKKQTKEYSELDPKRPAIPTIELIATIAQRAPGPEGLYIAAPNEKVIKEYSKFAKENGALLMLDVQLGQATVMEAIEEIAPFLKESHVHLAIDTEYSIDEGQTPGEDLGQVEGADIQEAIEYVDQLVVDHDLPDKIVLVHQFGHDIVRNKEKIKSTKHVQVPLNYDGFGDQAVKEDSYGLLVREQPIQYAGFKVFHKNDNPVMSPKEVLELEPAPAVVNYQ